MKTRTNRKRYSKTRRQKGGGVFSKPIREKQNVNISQFVKSKPIESLTPKEQLNYYTTRRKLQEREKELAGLIGIGAGAGAGAGASTSTSSTTSSSRFERNYIEQQKKKIQEKINSLRNKLNSYNSPEFKVKVGLHEFPKSSFGTINLGRNPNGSRTEVKNGIRPVQLTTFVISPEKGHISPFGPSGPQYSKFEELLMEEIYTLRAEAFPEEYGFKNGKPSDGFSELLLGIFPNSFTIENGKKISSIHPYTNVKHILWIPPMHCDPIPKTLSNRNLAFCLYYYTAEQQERGKQTQMAGFYRLIAHPSLISTCSINICKLKSGNNVAEIVGVATFKKFQKMKMASKLLTEVLNFFSMVNLNSPTTGASLTISGKAGNVKYNTDLHGIDFFWLYYDRTKPHLGKFYSSFGFKELTEKETDSELKEIYIGREYFIKRAIEKKWENFKETAKEEHRKITMMKLEFVNEEDYNDWVKQKKDYAYNFWGKYTKNDGTPMPDALTGKTIKDFANLDAYKQAMFDIYIKKPVYKPVVITKEIRNELNTLTAEEEQKATEFLRENVQMVLSTADWVYTMNKITQTVLKTYNNR